MILGALWGSIADGTLWTHLQMDPDRDDRGLHHRLRRGRGHWICARIFSASCHAWSLRCLPVSYTIPKIALAPLFVILLGVDNASKVALVAVTVFFLVLTSTVEGVHKVDRGVVNALVLIGATQTKIIRKVLIWAALPSIFTGMRIAVRYAFTTTLLAERSPPTAGSAS